jgi:predicted DNA-binding WGR domain protein
MPDQITSLGRARLTNKQPGHYKEYIITFSQEFGRYVVRLAWGRIGNGKQTKTKSFFSRSAAEVFVRETLHTRVEHGYCVEGDITLEI